jgi:hypothetical protein
MTLVEGTVGFNVQSSGFKVRFIVQQFTALSTLNRTQNLVNLEPNPEP